jgi:hypothetical protein
MEPLQNPRHDLTPRLTHGAGRQGHTSPSGRGRKMSLTSPLIDQAISRFGLDDECIGDISPTRLTKKAAWEDMPASQANSRKQPAHC